MPIGRVMGAQADARRAVVAAAGAERLRRHRSGLDRRRAAPPRYRQRFCRPRAASADPLALLDRGLGPLASRDTRETIARAGSRHQALALLVMAPEFLRR